MYYENLPIFRSAMNLAVYIETIVKSFEKYHKYTIGVNLRERSQKMLFLISQANMEKDKTRKLFQLRDMCCFCVITAGTLLEFFDKKIKTVSLYCQTPSSSDTSNRYQHTSKPINSKISANFFTVFGLPTGCCALEGHSFNFALQNSSNVPAVQTECLSAVSRA